MTNGKEPSTESGGDPERLQDDLERARNLLGDLDMQPSQQQVSGMAESNDLDRLFEVTRSIHGTLDLDELLPLILDVALRHSRAERGIFFYFDPSTGESHPWAVRGLEMQAVDEAERVSRTVIEWARNRQAVHTADVMEDPQFREIQSLSLHQIRSLLCIPVCDGDRVCGAIYLDNRQSGTRIGPEAIRFVTILAGLAAVAIQNAERFAKLSRSHLRLVHELSHHEQFPEIIGRSEPMRLLLDSIRRVGQTDFPVLLQGEVGSGKEMAARALHRVSSRREGPFVAQNSAAIPVELLESEFFGHAKGAFTGAHTSRDGLFRLADGGTLFLDEIADLDYRLQAKLLRVLEDGVVRPVGSNREFKVDFRLLSATSVDLERAVAEGKFREDLFYRLNVVVLRVPALRERSTDIPVLVQHFLTTHLERGSNRRIRFTPGAMRMLLSRPWKGNIRELEHFVKRTIVLAQGDTIDAQDVAGILEVNGGAMQKPLLPVGQLTLAEMEEWSIREALLRADNNQLRAAEILGIHRNALIRRMHKLGLGRTQS